MRALAAVLLLLAAPPANALSELQAARGRALFERPWSADGAGRAAGLGPLFNARGCGECHPGGGRGDPAGPGLVLRLARDPALGRQLQTSAVPGLSPEGRLGLAREGVVEVVLGGGERVTLTRPRPDRPGSLRLAPPLRGAGLLARVPRGTILALADPEDRDGDGVSGRAGPGLFGRAAEHATLTAQVADALSLDLGVGTAARPGAAGDCTAAQGACLVSAGPRGVEADEAAVGALVAYLEALRPRPAGPPDADGEALFAAFGYAGCHVPALTDSADPAVTGTTVETIRPYTDLLLHDLGDGMADALGREWRTAPLWGLREGGALLHDGRAGSVVEAILWHGGEAAAARERFRTAQTRERHALVRFVSGL